MVDVHRIQATSFDGLSPSFIASGTVLPVAPPLFAGDLPPAAFANDPKPTAGRRYFDSAAKDTWLDYGGYVVRGRDFQISAEQWAKNKLLERTPEGLSLARLSSSPLRSPDFFALELRNTRPDQNDYYYFRLLGHNIHNPTFSVLGDEEKGFDSATFFWSQSLPSNPVGGTRNVQFKASAPFQGAFTFVPDGPLSVAHSPAGPQQSEVTLTPNGAGYVNNETF